jgi:hypothetical protein
MGRMVRFTIRRIGSISLILLSLRAEGPVAFWFVAR